LDQNWAVEPWRAVPGQVFIKSEEGWGSIVNAEDWFIAKVEDSLDPEANAERIVACVNALRGLDPAALAEAVAALRACAAALSAPGAGALAGAGEAGARAAAALAALTAATGGR
jgi:hypothetical protein